MALNTTVNINGYAEMKGAVSPDLAKQAAEEISKGMLKVVGQIPKCKLIEIPQACLKIRNNLREASSFFISECKFILTLCKEGVQTPVAMLLGRSIPLYEGLNVDTFLTTEQDLLPKFSVPGVVFLTVALTDLDHNTGWHTFFKGSHRRHISNSSFSPD